MLVEAYNNNDFADQVNNASLVLTDGMPLVKLANLKSNFNHERGSGRTDVY
jgi:UDP-N-acetyl-D-mannosaminuronic acid transferase (WecB/TagA/CpsF family)